MENRGRKSMALFIVISTFYLALFDWDWPALSHYKFNLAYTAGMTLALLFSMAERFLKHANTLDFQWGKLIKTHLLAFLIFYPALVITILPALEPPRGIWKLDYKLSFLLTYFFINVGPKIVTIYERLDLLLTLKNRKKD